MKNIKILFNKFLGQEEGISLVASITFNLVTLLLATSWAYFASSQFDTTVLKIEGIRNTYLLKGYNSLVRAVKPNIDWGKAQYLAGFNITYNPSSFIPNADNYNGLGNVNIEKVQSDGGTDIVLSSQIDLNGNTVTSSSATAFARNNTFARFFWLTDCERQRETFTPPDSIACTSEPCSNSDNLLQISGIFDGPFHTNDFVYFAGPTNVSTMVGCVTANGKFQAPPPIPLGSLQFPPTILTGANFLDPCNSSINTVAPGPYISFEITPELVLNAAKGAGIFLQGAPDELYRIVFGTGGIQVFKSTKNLVKLIELFGSATWTIDRQPAYPENGAIFVAGDVYVSGIVNGDVTIGTCGDIYIDNDLKYACTDSTGLNFIVPPEDCGAKLGLIAGKNVYIETKHIAIHKGFTGTTQASGNYYHGNKQEGVIINAGIIALKESFKVFSCDFPNFARFPGDPYGGVANPNYPLLGNHGTINLLGSIAQQRRGIINNGVRGGYGGKLGPTGIPGPQRYYSYDTRFVTSPPRYFFDVKGSNLDLVVR